MTPAAVGLLLLLSLAVALVTALLAAAWDVPNTAALTTLSADAPGAAFLPPAPAPPLIPIVVAALTLGAAAGVTACDELSL